MAELTKERLTALSNRENVGAICGDEIAEMARQLLASMEQEPVYQVLGDGNWADYSKQQLEDLLESKPSTLFRVAYAAPQLPQPAVVVSEAQSKKLFDEWSGGDGALGELRASGVPDEFISMLKEFSLATWEACREALLQHHAPFIVTSDHRMMEMPKAEDIGAVAAMLQGAEPSQVWIPCSERMPDADGNYWGWWSESKRQGPVWFIKSELQAQFQSSEITHWMPLPACPKGE